MNYEQLLARAKEQLPEVQESQERFEIPKVKGRLQGTMTIISNFGEIADTLDRPKKHLQKYLNKELGAKSAVKRDSFLVINGKMSSSRINEKIDAYAAEFVICPNCGKPDTDMMKIGQALFIKCNVDGSRTRVHQL